MDFDFWIVDVFTGESFGGNQLAVVTDATGIIHATDAIRDAICTRVNLCATRQRTGA